MVQKKNPKKEDEGKYEETKTNFEDTISVLAEQFISNLKEEVPHNEGVSTVKHG